MTALRNYIDRVSNPLFLLDESEEYVRFSNRAAWQEHGYDQESRIKVSDIIKILPADHYEQPIAQFNHKWYLINKEQLQIEGEEVHLMGLNTITGQPDSQTLKNWKNMIAVMLHRLRSPLTGVRGYVELLEEENKDDTLNKRFDSIHKGFNQVFNLMDELEILYHLEDKFDSGKFESVNVPELLSSLLFNFEEGNRSKFSVENSTHKKSNIDTNPEYLSKVLLQLMTNSLMHAEGDIKIHFSDDNGGSIHISNNNPGIPDEIKPKIFHPFVTSRANELGIGLTLAMLYARKLGCLVLFREDEENITFIIQFPID